MDHHLSLLSSVHSGQRCSYRHKNSAGRDAELQAVPLHPYAPNDGTDHLTGGKTGGSYAEACRISTLRDMPPEKRGYHQRRGNKRNQPYRDRAQCREKHIACDDSAHANRPEG